VAPVYMQGWARRAALDASTSAAGALVEHGLTVPERFPDAKPWYSAYDGTYWGATTMTDQVARHYTDKRAGGCNLREATEPGQRC
jgi:hypothetical protein